MSIGYISKKRLATKRKQRLRKKYKNFSCETCAKSGFGNCKKKYVPTPIGILVGNFESCYEWKAKK